MRIIKKKRSYKSLLLSVVIIALLSQFISVKATNQPLLLLAYRDLDEKHGILTVELEDIPQLVGATIPISFNPKALRVCGVDNNGEFCDISDKVSSEADLYNGSIGIKFSEDFFFGAWDGNVLCNDYYPKVDNKDGLIKIMLYSLKSGEEIIGKNELCEIYFEKLTDDKPQLTIADGNTGYAYDKSSPNGAIFLGDRTEYSVKIRYDGDAFYEYASNVTIDNDEDFIDESGNAVQIEKNHIIPKDAFSDVTAAHWANEYIYGLYSKKVISGYPDGTFRPEKYVTRAELTKMVMTAVGYDVRASAGFTDVNQNDWFYNFVNAASYSGYVKGYPDMTFKPNEYITRQDLCTVLGRAFLSVRKTDGNAYSFADEESISDYARSHIKKMRELEIVNGRENNMFLPLENATRAEVAKIIYLCMEGNK